MADEKKTYLVNVESNLKKYADEAAEAKKKVDDLTVANKKLRDSGTASAAEIEASNAALKNSQDEYRKAANLVKTVIAANSSEAGSRKQLGEQLKLQEQALGKLGSAYIKDAQGVDVLNPKYVELRNQIKGTKDQIIQYDKSLGDGRSSVGLYSEAINGALGKFQMMPGALGSAAGGVAKVNTAFKMLAANPIIAIIMVVVGAFMLLIKALKGNDEATEKLGGVMKGLSNIVKEVFGRIISLGKAVIDFLRGDFKGAVEEAKNAFTGFGEAVKNAFKGGIEQQELMNKIEDAEIEVLERIAQRNKEIAEIKKNSRNMDESAFERSKEFAKAEDLRRANLLDELAIQKDRVALAEMELKNTNANQRTDEQRKKVAEERAKLINIETQAIEDQTNLLKRKIALDKEAHEDQKKYTEDLIKLKMLEAGGDPELIKEALKLKYEEEVKAMKAGSVEMLIAKLEYENAVNALDQEVVKKSQAALQKEIDDYKDAQEKKKEAAIEFAEWDKERQLIDSENKLAILELQNTYEFELQRQALKLQYNQEVANAEKTGADITLINQKYSLAKKKIDELELKSKLSAYASFAGNIATIFGKNTAIGRAAAVAQTTIATLQSAIEAFKAMSGIPYVGPALGAVAAAAALASGYATVKEILNTKSGLPGDTGGGSAPSMPTAITSTPAAQRTYATPTGSTVLTQPQLSQEQLNTLPNQNLLTAADIAKALESMPRPVVTVEDINAKTASVRKVEVRATI